MKKLKKLKNILDSPPDVEAIFEFNGARKTAAADGYLTVHCVADDCFTTGIHHYYGVFSVPPDGKADGTITFLFPNAYPHSLWIGKRINIQEGYKVVGYATITKIFNPILEAEN